MRHPFAIGPLWPGTLFAVNKSMKTPLVKVKRTLNFSQNNSKTILFIDSESYYLDNIYSLFPIRFKVHTAQTLEAAWKVLLTNKIDCIFCNVNLTSGQSGLELLKVCKANGINVPFILVSGDSKTKSLTYTKPIGVVDVLQKPLNPEKMHRQLETYFSSTPA